MIDIANLGIGLVSGLIGLVIGLAVNACVMWFVANVMMSFKDKITFKMCFFCAVGLFVVTLLTFGILLIPLSFISTLAAIFFYWKASIAVIEGSFEETEGGLTFLIIYTIVNFVILAIMSSSEL